MGFPRKTFATILKCSYGNPYDQNTLAKHITSAEVYGQHHLEPYIRERRYHNLQEKRGSESTKLSDVLRVLLLVVCGGQCEQLDGLGVEVAVHVLREVAVVRGTSRGVAVVHSAQQCVRATVNTTRQKQGQLISIWHNIGKRNIICCD